MEKLKTAPRDVRSGKVWSHVILIKQIEWLIDWAWFNVCTNTI